MTHPTGRKEDGAEGRGTFSCWLWGHKFVEMEQKVHWPPEYLKPPERIVMDVQCDYHTVLRDFCVRCGSTPPTTKISTDL